MEPDSGEPGGTAAYSAKMSSKHSKRTFISDERQVPAVGKEKRNEEINNMVKENVITKEKAQKLIEALDKKNGKHGK